MTFKHSSSLILILGSVSHWLFSPLIASSWPDLRDSQQSKRTRGQQDNPSGLIITMNLQRRKPKMSLPVCSFTYCQHRQYSGSDTALKLGKMGPHGASWRMFTLLRSISLSVCGSTMRIQQRWSAAERKEKSSWEEKTVMQKQRGKGREMNINNISSHNSRRRDQRDQLHCQAISHWHQPLCWWEKKNRPAEPAISPSSSFSTM